MSLTCIKQAAMATAKWTRIRMKVGDIRSWREGAEYGERDRSCRPRYRLDSSLREVRNHWEVLSREITKTDLYFEEFDSDIYKE